MDHINITAAGVVEREFVYIAEMNNFTFLGEARQGQALLALGLAQRLKEIRNLKDK